jgi:hypothetical protein
MQHKKIKQQDIASFLEKEIRNLEYDASTEWC